ncbi:hypothetical protein [Pseudodesulfovibrio nedwellii]|uniref:hypothetical protein n=1 Tax=Pseudodesulfovibrio nedwellii TaxID=2973072 RepID=UPI00248F5BB6|nr:hypothetical protein [Pseudodesulfovibrio nedwellii]
MSQTSPCGPSFDGPQLTVEAWLFKTARTKRMGGLVFYENWRDFALAWWRDVWYGECPGYCCVYKSRIIDV